MLTHFPHAADARGTSIFEFPHTKFKKKPKFFLLGVLRSVTSLKMRLVDGDVPLSRSLEMQIKHPICNLNHRLIPISILNHFSPKPSLRCLMDAMLLQVHWLEVCW